jgi:hypothetical protein
MRVRSGKTSLALAAIAVSHIAMPLPDVKEKGRGYLLIIAAPFFNA